MKYYITRFVRKDLKPCEDYYYNSLDDAKKHMGMFIDDDSNLYRRIEIEDSEGTTIDILSF